MTSRTSLRLVLAIAVLLAAILLAGVCSAELVDPDGENNPADIQDNGGTACNAADCTADVTDNSTATAVCDSSGSGGTATILYTFASPSSSPTTGANEQTIQGSVSRHDDGNNGTSCAHDAGGNDPIFDVEIYCNGTASGVLIASAVSITGDAQAFSGTFTFGTTIGTATCASDGSDLEILWSSTRSGGGPSVRRWAALEELEWDASVAAAGGRSRRTF